jgi:hypothetical protein
MTEIIETKEVAIVKQQATKALTAANELTIESQEDLAKATDVLSKIKTVGKMIKERKEAITKPLNESLKSIRDLFKPIETNHEEAERIIKSKMLVWQDAEEKRIKKEQDAIAARVEKGTMKPETAVKKMENVGEVQTTTKGNVGTVSTKIIKKYRVVDESKLPREFLMPDIGKITEALKAGQTVPGAEVYEEKVIAAR